MKRFLTSVAAFLFFVGTSNGQEKGYVSVSLGGCFPAGDFASKDVDNDHAGFADPGGAFDISFAYKFGKHFGICTMLNLQANPVDKEPYLERIREEQPLITWTGDADSWASLSMLVGGYGNFPIGASKFSFDARVMMGVVTASSPEINLNGSFLGANAWAKIERSTASTIGILLGGGFKFDVATRICLLANMNILSARPEFRDVKTTYSSGDPKTDTFRREIGTLNLGFGIGVRL